MDNEIFRKKSIDRFTSPEQLNDYLRVARPSIWISLSAIIVLLLGLLGFATFGKISSKLTTGVSLTFPEYYDSMTALAKDFHWLNPIPLSTPPAHD